VPVILSKVCSTCGLEKPTSEYYSNGYQPSGVKKYKARCKKCEESFRLKSYIHFIIKTLEETGRTFACERCGYAKNSAALCFHHKDPTKKDFGLATVSVTRRSGVAEEIAKCELLCSNCHMEEHYPNRMIVDKD